MYIIHMLLFSSKPASKNYQFCKIWFKVHHHLGSREGNVKWVCCWRIQSMIWKYFLSSCVLHVVHFIDSVKSLYILECWKGRCHAQQCSHPVGLGLSQWAQSIWWENIEAMKIIWVVNHIMGKFIAVTTTTSLPTWSRLLSVGLK